MKMTEFKKGKVMLVGAGPGDPDLLTLRAIKALESASLILYDNLVSEGIRALFPEGTPAIYVGKCKDRHSIRQEDLNDLLLKWAGQGKTVARLKGGDPFVFGRGGAAVTLYLCFCASHSDAISSYSFKGKKRVLS